MNHILKRKNENLITVLGVRTADSAVEIGQELGVSESQITGILSAKRGAFLPKTSKTRNFNVPGGYPNVVLFGNGNLREIFITMNPATQTFYGILVQRYNDQFKGYTLDEVHEAYFAARMPAKPGEQLVEMKEKWIAITLMDEDHIANVTGTEIPAKTRQDVALQILSREQYARWYEANFPAHELESLDTIFENDRRREQQRLSNGFRVWVKYTKPNGVAHKEMLGILPTGFDLCSAIYEQDAVEDISCVDGYYTWLKGHFERRSIDVATLQEIFVVTNTDETVYVKVSTERTAADILEAYYTAHPERRPVVEKDSDDMGNAGATAEVGLMGRMGNAIRRFIDQSAARFQVLALGA